MGGLGGDNTEMPVGVFRLRRVTAPNVANAPSLAPSRGSSQFGHTSFPGGWHQCRKLCKLLKDSRLPKPDDQFQGHVPRCFQGRSGRGLAPLNLATRYSSPPLLPRSAGTPKDRAPGSPEQHGSNCSRRESTARLMGFAVGMVKLDERSEHGPAKHGGILGAGSLN